MRGWPGCAQARGQVAGAAEPRSLCVCDEQDLGDPAISLQQEAVVGQGVACPVLERRVMCQNEESWDTADSTRLLEALGQKLRGHRHLIFKPPSFI